MAQCPSSIYLVLDLDSTLIYTQDNMDDYELYKFHPQVYCFELDGSKMWGVFRPHVFEFLRFAQKYFTEVYIWSAAQEPYVMKLKRLLFKGLPNPKIILSRRSCVLKAKGEVNKPLERLFKLHPDANYTNTLHLDDRADTFSPNHSNGIQIPVFEPTAPDTDDVALVQLMAWLCQSEVMASTDVRTLPKDTIFTTPLLKYYQAI